MLLESKQFRQWASLLAEIPNSPSFILFSPFTSSENITFLKFLITKWRFIYFPHQAVLTVAQWPSVELNSKVIPSDAMLKDSHKAAYFRCHPQVAGPQIKLPFQSDMTNQRTAWPFPSGSTNLLEQLTELKEIFSFIGLLRNMVKDTKERPG